MKNVDDEFLNFQQDLKSYIETYIDNNVKSQFFKFNVNIYL
jgi:hypothetical protein